MNRLQLARSIALLVPAALLAGAYGSQIFGGLFPCEMCWWQRYAHEIAIVLALVAIAAAGRAGNASRLFVWLAALAIAISGAIGFYQAGVELKWFEGFTQCTSGNAGLSADELLKKIMDSPMVRCDQIQWSWLGISMAGWNGIVSVGTALLVLWLTLSKRRAAA